MVRVEQQRAGSLQPGSATPIAEPNKPGLKDRVNAEPEEAFDVQLSPSARARAQAATMALRRARETPDIDEEKVGELKAKIVAGSYYIDSAAVADAMLREAYLDHYATNEDPSE